MTTPHLPATAAPAATAGAVTVDSLVLGLVGSGGDGVALLGDLLLKMAANQGYYGMMVQSYGPQIRGGESAAILRLAADEVRYEGDLTDILLCFRLADLKRFQSAVRLAPGSLVILDEADADPIPAWLSAEGVTVWRFPFTRTDLEPGTQEPKNMLGLALLVRVLGWPADLARMVLGERFGHRPEALNRNLAAFDRGWQLRSPAGRHLPLPRATGLFAETGNEASARGAMEAGLRFFAGYPITPSSEIMETLIEELPETGGRLVQAEDEIAALGMVLGASFGGTPSMTATSGPGLSLMTEMMGLASMAELPTVIVDCQRAGPATGMPSRTEQSDLYHAIFAGHGDFPRAVLGVFDVVHAREVMHKAFHLSESYQLPVLVLSDAYIAQRRQIRGAVPPPPAPTRRRAWVSGDAPARFDLTGDHGVTPFRVPGSPEGTYLAAGIEHTPDGAPTADGAMHQAMNEKRFRKLDALAVETAGWFRTLGRPEAKLGIVAWGSQFGLLDEWVREHPDWRVFLPEIIHPFPLEAFTAWRAGLSRTAVVELNFQGQFFSYLSTVADLARVERVTRSGGPPLNLSELSQLLEEARR